MRDSIVLRSDTVLGVQFPNRYQDKRKQLRSDLSELKTGIVQLNGFTRIVITRKKDFDNNKMEVVYCRQFRDLLQALVQE